MATQRLNLPLRSQCPSAKIRHPNRLVAEVHREQLERWDAVNRPTAGRLNSYFCGQCQAWHVGHVG